MNSVYERRQQQKRDAINFRAAAAQRLKAAGITANVDPHATVNQVADGAYVEVQLWIPNSHIVTGENPT